MRCESLTDGKMPEDAIAAWVDADGVDYCLRPRDPPLEQSGCGSGETAISVRHWSSALFEVGKNILVKVKYSPPGWYSVEGDAMNLVRSRTPDVPVPECLHFWIDRKWNRYFLIMPRVHGVLLDDAWWGLEEEEKQWVTDELAGYQTTVARTITSKVFQGVAGDDYGPIYFNARDVCAKKWDADKQGTSGPLTPEQLREHMSRVSGGEEILDVGTEFHLFHGDMGPGNVILSVGERDGEGKRDVSVAGIIDWELAGFVPHWWLTLYPVLPHGNYALSLSDEQMDTNINLAWNYVSKLNVAMQEYGWECGRTHGAWFAKYNEGRHRQEEQRYREAKSTGRLKWVSDTA